MHADKERAALGFMPSSAYSEAAEQGKLWIAVKKDGDKEQYAGHLFFGGAFPRLRIFQMFVKRDHQRKGVASLLLARLVKESEKANYLTISARVASDLGANSFWQQQGFEVVTSRPGGKTTQRTILVREKLLNSPRLFDLLDPSAPPTDHDLRLADRLSARAQIYAFDINVLLDIVKDRPRAEAVARIFSAAMANHIRLFVAPEFIAELERAKRQGSDPVLDLASTLPQFPPTSAQGIESLLEELGSIIFTDRSKESRLRNRDHSDVLHLATAIQNKAAGFITSEKAILRRHSVLLDKYEMDVVGVAEFAEWLAPHAWAEHEHQTLEIGTGRELKATELRQNAKADVEKFLKLFNIDNADINEALSLGTTASPRRRYVIYSGHEIVGFASWPAPQKILTALDTFIFLNEESPHAESALDYTFSALLIDCGHCGPNIVRIFSRESKLTERVAESLGFRRSITSGNQHGLLQKVCLGRVVRESNWQDVREDLSKRVQLTLQERPPNYVDSTTNISLTSPTDVRLSIPVVELEELLGPALFLLPGRTGAIVPIRKEYAEALLGTSPQLQLLPKREASLLFRRTYYSGKNTLTTMKAGTLLCFYESKRDKGSGSIVACARSIETSVGSPSESALSIRRGGVLEPTSFKNDKQDVKAITRFDTVMKFSKPVPLARLRKLSCDDGSSFVTAKRITHEQLCKILDEGQPFV
jgi:GNAT superfamily N-acetyltransferase/predicted nucleic acid-binding protein